jgi:predicted nucleotidyltransferase
MKQEYLEEICKNLIKYDQDIVEIIQFGSSVYAPEYSKDIDLLVITKKAKEYEKYFDIAILKMHPSMLIFWYSTLTISLEKNY